MKLLKTLTLCGMLALSKSYGAVNTLTLIDSYPTRGGKVCIYSDGHRTETTVKKGAGSCPSKKTFH
ncbi:Uncharacterised protein [Serratia quinivorans]|nr:hypothetical protein ADP72_13905 [Serratia plymuthica]CAI1832339.1 Uncharacterised protein [Serratia quinivorans]